MQAHLTDLSLSRTQTSAPIPHHHEEDEDQEKKKKKLSRKEKREAKKLKRKLEQQKKQEQQEEGLVGNSDPTSDGSVELEESSSFMDPLKDIIQYPMGGGTNNSTTTSTTTNRPPMRPRGPSFVVDRKLGVGVGAASGLKGLTKAKTQPSRIRLKHNSPNPPV
jgi:hypothetical protein